MKRPNILLITSDQQHWNTLGISNPKIRTPNLDRLCREGTRFSRAYCPNPTCTPTRASIITGMYPSRHGAWSLGTKLPEEVPTVGEIFGRAGYATTLIGKAHFQPVAEYSRSNLDRMPAGSARPRFLARVFKGRGMASNTSRPRACTPTRRIRSEATTRPGWKIRVSTNWRDYFGSNGQAAPGRSQTSPARLGFTGRSFTTRHGRPSRTIADIEKQVVAQTQPFFTWASFHDPHPPYLVPRPWAEMYDPADMEPGTLLENEMELLPEHFRLTQQENPDYSAYQETPHSNHGFHSHLTDDAQLRREMAIYYGMTSFMDQQIGRILDALDRLGIAENTLVVFSTDHGHFMGQHGLTAKGAFHYEDLLKLPFIVRWPGRVAAGAQSAALQSLVDLAPSFLSACDLPIPGTMEGVDQSAVWRGETPRARDEVLVEFRHQPTRLQLRTLITQRHKLTVYRDQSYGELFDLEDDPDERINRWDAPEYADAKAELFQRFVNAEMRREPMPHPRIANA